jgi:NADH-quinone oxidoreductase subunit C
MTDTPIEDEPTNDAPEPPADEVAAALLVQFPDAIFHLSHTQPVLYVTREDWLPVATWLRDDQQFAQCIDITAVDHLVDEARISIDGVTPERFEVVANFLSLTRNRRIRVIAELPAGAPVIPSLANLYPGVTNPEREVFDLLGVVFDGHPDLTRILMPDDWVGHPLRKDAASARVPVTFKGDRTPA